MSILPQVADAMQEILTETPDVLACESGFVKRQRKLSGGGFAQTLVFGWLSNPNSTVDELSQTAATLGISISPQGIDKRFTREAVSTLIAGRSHFCSVSMGYNTT